MTNANDRKGLISIDDFQKVIEEQIKVNDFHKVHPPIAGGAGASVGGSRPAFPDPSTMTTRWKDGVQSKAQNWLDGIQNPRADFKQSAINANATYKANMAKSLSEDAWVKAMQKVDPNAAIATAVAVGTAGYVAGAMARVNKFTNSMQKWVPLATAAVQAVRALPSVSDVDRENRAVMMIRGFKAAKKASAGR